MRKLMRNCVFVTIASILLAGSMVFAQGKSKGRGNKPPGWQKGEKKGWNSDVPPGIEKKGGSIPPGLSKKGGREGKQGRPSGWSREEKEGWGDSDIPPGLAEEKASKEGDGREEAKGKKKRGKGKRKKKLQG